MLMYLIAGIAALAMISGLAYKTYEAGADKVRLEWAADVAARKAEAEKERARQDALREAQDKEATRRLADEKKRTTGLMASLEAHIRASGAAAKCPVPDSLRDDWNRANAGPEGERTGTVPPAGRKPAPPH
jgi:Flp pilus assembly protein TadB